jgi:hypothetical protein
MMRTLSTASAAVALGLDRRVLDNILSREGRSIILTGRRGRGRRIPVGALEQIAVAIILNRDLGVGIARAVEIARQLIDSPSSSVAVGSLGALSFDVSRLRGALEFSIDEALESVAEPIRGRPRSRK